MEETTTGDPPDEPLRSERYPVGPEVRPGLWDGVMTFIGTFMSGAGVFDAIRR
jgi:hypothetical protein